MRSVVVVLPASMWAMIPMFRVFSSVVFFAVVVTARHLLRLAARPQARAPESTVLPPSPVRLTRTGPLPAVVSERLVRLSHPVEVVLPLEGAPLRAQRVEQLVRQPLAHLLLAPLTRVPHDPADREGTPAPCRDLDRDLVRRAAHPPGLDLEGRGDVADRLLHHRDGIAAGAVADALQRPVDHALGGGLLSVLEHLVHHLRDQSAAVDGVRVERTPGDDGSTRHYRGAFAPYLERALRRSVTPAASSA